MENPQAQMQQGVPQQGGQDPQIQQIMQLVQQMMQQGVQPVEAAAELLSKQVPPEIVMQVFVQMGMPEQDAQAAIEQAMQGGQQPQNSGEEQMEGQASNPQKEMAEQGAPAPDQSGQPSPAEEIQMKYGGRMPKRLRSYAEGGDNQELQAVMQQVQDMMSKGADARQVMEQIQAAAQQGQISPDVATSVMEQLSGMQQAENPQGSDSAMAEQSQDPQMMDPNMAAPDAAMGIAKFGGNLKKLMSRAYGGPSVAPGTDSKTYAQDRTSMFVGAVKNNAYKSTLDDEFPSLGGNQMAYGGDLPKAVDGFDVTKYKTADEAELAAYRYKQGLSPEEQAKFDVSATLKTWKEPEFKFEPGKQYELDPTTGKPRLVTATKDDGYVRDANGNAIGLKFAPTGQYNQGYGAINPVAYQNPMGNGLWNNIYAGTSPFARMIGGFNMNNAYDPRITGANLPGGMNAEQFLGAVGANGLVPGMAGNVAGQNWRVGEAEKFKEGSIWKGNRRKGVRYQIDWGNAAAMNPAGPQNAPAATTTTNPVTTTTNPVTTTNTSASTNPQVRLNTMTQTGGSGMGAMESLLEDPTIVANQTVVNPANSVIQQPAAEVNPALNSAANLTADGLTKTGGSGMGAMEGLTEDPAGIVDKPVIPLVQPQRSSIPYNRVNTAGSGIGAMENLDEQFFAYGGRVTQQDLANAVALINRAFGGMIPKAVDGMDLGSQDTDGNGIPDYLQAENLPANQPNPFGNKGTIEQSAGKKLDINWNQVGAAAGDMYMNNAAKVTNFMNKMNAMNPERDMAKMSALNRPSNTYDKMKQGLYDQAGNFIPNDIGNQVLNPTDVYYNNQKQVFAYGGKVYEIGGEVDLDDNELEQLAAAGFKLTKV